MYKVKRASPRAGRKSKHAVARQKKARFSTKAPITATTTNNKPTKTTKVALNNTTDAKVIGLDDLPVKFSDLGVDKLLEQSLHRQGIVAPSEIQQMAIPTLLSTDKDVAIAAQTGQGKTLTYVIPLVQRLGQDEKLLGKVSGPSQPRGLVLVPTRELAQQVEKSVKSLSYTDGYRVSSLAVTGDQTASFLKQRLRGEQSNTSLQLINSLSSQYRDQIRFNATIASRFINQLFKHNNWSYVDPLKVLTESTNQRKKRAAAHFKKQQQAKANGGVIEDDDIDINEDIDDELDASDNDISDISDDVDEEQDGEEEGQQQQNANYNDIDQNDPDAPLIKKLRKRQWTAIKRTIKRETTLHAYTLFGIAQDRYHTIESLHDMKIPNKIKNKLARLEAPKNQALLSKALGKTDNDDGKDSSFVTVELDDNLTNQSKLVQNHATKDAAQFNIDPQINIKRLVAHNNILNLEHLQHIEPLAARAIANDYIEAIVKQELQDSEKLQTTIKMPTPLFRNPKKQLLSKRPLQTDFDLDQDGGEAALDAAIAEVDDTTDYIRTLAKLRQKANKGVSGNNNDEKITKFWNGPKDLASEDGDDGSDDVEATPEELDAIAAAAPTFIAKPIIVHLPTLNELIYRYKALVSEQHAKKKNGEEMSSDNNYDNVDDISVYSDGDEGYDAENAMTIDEDGSSYEGEEGEETTPKQKKKKINIDKVLASRDFQTWLRSEGTPEEQAILDKYRYDEKQRLTQITLAQQEQQQEQQQQQDQSLEQQPEQELRLPNGAIIRKGTPLPKFDMSRFSTVKPHEWPIYQHHTKDLRLQNIKLYLKRELSLLNNYPHVMNNITEKNSIPLDNDLVWEYWKHKYVDANIIHPDKIHTTPISIATPFSKVFSHLDDIHHRSRSFNIDVDYITRIALYTLKTLSPYLISYDPLNEIQNNNNENNNTHDNNKKQFSYNYNNVALQVMDYIQTLQDQEFYDLSNSVIHDMEENNFLKREAEKNEGFEAFQQKEFYHKQMKLQRNIDLLICTPSRLINLLEHGAVKLNKINYVVIDEADMVLTSRTHIAMNNETAKKHFDHDQKENMTKYLKMDGINTDNPNNPLLRKLAAMQIRNGELYRGILPLLHRLKNQYTFEHQFAPHVRHPNTVFDQPHINVNVEDRIPATIPTIDPKTGKLIKVLPPAAKRKKKLQQKVDPKTLFKLNDDDGDDYIGYKTNKKNNNNNDSEQDDDDDNNMIESEEQERNDLIKLKQVKNKIPSYTVDYGLLLTQEKINKIEREVKTKYPHLYTQSPEFQYILQDYLKEQTISDFGSYRDVLSTLKAKMLSLHDPNFKLIDIKNQMIHEKEQKDNNNNPQVENTNKNNNKNKNNNELSLTRANIATHLEPLQFIYTSASLSSKNTEFINELNKVIPLYEEQFAPRELLQISTRDALCLPTSLKQTFIQVGQRDKLEILHELLNNDDIRLPDLTLLSTYQQQLQATSSTNDNNNNNYESLTATDKYNKLRDNIMNKKYLTQTIVFCNTIASARAVYHSLAERNISVTTTHSGISPKFRGENWERFLNNDVAVMVATDIASRGVHHPTIRYVVNFDFPLSPIDYLHRAGRAAALPGLIGSMRYVTRGEQHGTKVVNNNMALNKDNVQFTLSPAPQDENNNNNTNQQQQQQQNNNKDEYANADDMSLDDDDSEHDIPTTANDNKKNDNDEKEEKQNNIKKQNIILDHQGKPIQKRGEVISLVARGDKVLAYAIHEASKRLTPITALSSDKKDYSVHAQLAANANSNNDDSRTRYHPDIPDDGTMVRRHDAARTTTLSEEKQYQIEKGATQYSRSKYMEKKDKLMRKFQGLPGFKAGSQQPIAPAGTRAAQSGLRKAVNEWIHRDKWSNVGEDKRKVDLSSDQRRADERYVAEQTAYAKSLGFDKPLLSKTSKINAQYPERVIKEKIDKALQGQRTKSYKNRQSTKQYEKANRPDNKYGSNTFNSTTTYNKEMDKFNKKSNFHDDDDW